MLASYVCSRNSVKFGVNLEHITILAEVRIVSIYIYSNTIRFLAGKHYECDDIQKCIIFC
jgi:hypothetical protein